MEAQLVAELPDGPGWQFEPKWDGFRAIVARDGGDVAITSKSGKPLGRYFPEVVDAVARVPLDRFMLDGELILPIGDVLSFDALQQRLHPAASRVERLSRETPAQLMLFDCLAIGPDDLSGEPLSARRAALERFHAEYGGPSLLLSPRSASRGQAIAWLRDSGGALDGVVAKRLDEPYRAGERAMAKVKQLRTADCVVGGFRSGKKGEVVSLLLGLFDRGGTARPCRLHLLDRRCRSPGDRRAARRLPRRRGLHRQGAGRPEPVEQRPGERMGAAQARAGRRGGL